VDLLQHLGRDRRLALRQDEPVQELLGTIDGEVGQFRDGQAPHLHGEDLGAQPGTVAHGARDLPHESLVPLPRGVGLGLGVLAVDVVDRTLEPAGVAPFPAPPVLVLDVHLVVVAVEQRLPRALRQGSPRHVDGELQVLREGGDEAEVVLRPLPRPHRDGTLREGEVLVRHHEFGIHLHAGADPVALRARAVGGVEGEGARLDLGQGEGMLVGAGPLLGERDDALGIVLVAVDELGEHLALGEGQGGLDGVREALPDTVAHHETVHDHVDGVLQVLGERWRLGEGHDRAVHLRPGEALLLQLGQQLGVLALAPPDDRGEELEACPLRERGQPVDDLLRGLRGHDLTAGGAGLRAGPCEEQAQVVVHLRDRADGGPWVAVRPLLVDRHRGRQPLDEVDVGLVHLAEELAGVGREGLDVAPLPLGEDGVEGERRLPRAGQPGEHDEPVPGQLEGDVLEVVLAGPAH